MPSAFRPLILLAASLSLIACTSNPAPPGAPPELTAPPALSDGWHAVFQTTKVIDAPLEPLQAWIGASNEIVAAMEETDQIKKPVEVKVVSGIWPEEGSVRWLKFSDGHYTYERVLENNLPASFDYQVWGITSSASDHITYARGRQDWRTLADGTSEFTWTYTLRPNSIIKRPFVSGFLSSDMKPFMEGAIGRMAAKAETEFAGWRASDAAQ
ncbi:MAG: SRPBCC family protein [Pseudomonadota bacterium]